MDFIIVWGRCGEVYFLRGTLTGFPIWEIKNREKSAFRIEEPLYIPCYYVHTCPFLEFVSRSAFSFTNLLPVSRQNFPDWISDSIFRVLLRLKSCFSRTGFPALNLASELSFAVALPGTAHNGLNPDWMPVSFCYGKRWIPGLEIGRLGHRAANAHACLLEW